MLILYKYTTHFKIYQKIFVLGFSMFFPPDVLDRTSEISTHFYSIHGEYIEISVKSLNSFAHHVNFLMIDDLHYNRVLNKTLLQDIISTGVQLFCLSEHSL